MTNITKAAQDALAELADWHWSQAATLRKAASTSAMDKPEPVQSSLTRMADWHDAQKSIIRVALQDKAGEVQGEREAFEAFAQNCPMGRYNVDRKGEGYDSSHTQIMWDTWQARAAQPAPVVPDDVVRYRTIRDGLAYIEPHESGEIYVAGETGVYTKSGDEFDAAIDAIAASQQKQAIFEPCCDKEDRTLSGGCRNCGDPCL